MKPAFFQRAWTCPKQGYASDENEDAWRTVWAEQADTSTILLVVADGATEGVFSRSWARALVEAVTPEWPRLSDAELTTQLQALRQAYRPLPPGQEMAWNVKTKWMTEGSCATLLAATVTASAAGIELQAVAIGDCCLLVLRADGSLACSFPMAAAADFNTSPALVRSLFQPQLEYRRLAPTSLQVGDVLLVCTDAVGKWALQCIEEQATPQLREGLGNLLIAEAPAPPQAEVITIPLPVAPNRHTEQGLGVTATPSEPPARIIPRWKVPDFVQAWFPKKHAAPAPIQPAEEPPATASPLVTTTDETAPASFADWVTRAQAADNVPRMKNDDATLVLCVPLATTGAAPLEQVQTALRRWPDHDSQALPS